MKNPNYTISSEIRRFCFGPFKGAGKARHGCAVPPAAQPTDQRCQPNHEAPRRDPEVGWEQLRLQLAEGVPGQGLPADDPRDEGDPAGAAEARRHGEEVRGLGEGREGGHV